MPLGATTIVIGVILGVIAVLALLGGTRGTLSQVYPHPSWAGGPAASTEASTGPADVPTKAPTLPITPSLAPPALSPIHI
ncbi:hypothetical protein, partial [Microbacterium sp. ZW T5_56]|uniref:hypothetical protein n=1 Tax=Microbacterium sp. ZW T5_56 TaxID=3378081 RepID=UPI0038518C6E